MERFVLTDRDKELIAIGLEVLRENFDDDRHTVGCALLCSNGAVY